MTDTRTDIMIVGNAEHDLKNIMAMIKSKDKPEI